MTQERQEQAPTTVGEGDGAPAVAPHAAGAAPVAAPPLQSSAPSLPQPPAPDPDTDRGEVSTAENAVASVTTLDVSEALPVAVIENASPPAVEPPVEAPQADGGGSSAPEASTAAPAESAEVAEEEALAVWAAPPAPVEVTPPAEAQVPAADAGGELEEVTLPSSVQPPPVLTPGAAVGAEGRLHIVRHREARGRINRYDAIWRDDAGQKVDVEIREGPADHATLQREAEVLSSVQYGMLPQRYASLEQEGRRYLVLERLEGETLEGALQDGLGVDQAISVVLQLVQVTRRLHQAGWALLGLSPADVRLAQPIRLTQVGSAVRLGEAPPHAMQVAGYSAPELAHPAPVTAKEDVYTLGAILYRALAGQPLLETGAEQGALPFAVAVPGGPQLLAGALAPAEERVDVETFYHGLLALKQRLAQAALVLEVASGTSVGLNPTRPVNEDSCGYVTWSVADAAGLAQRALLCVADGMGGMEAGEVASRTALRTVLSAATTPAPPAGGKNGGLVHQEPLLDLVALVKRAATAVHGAALGRQMGTTVTCVEVHGGSLTLAHVGDTRAYLLRRAVLTQLTTDHSLVAAMVSSGVLTKEEARGHPDSNKVLRSLGSQRELPDGYVDTLEASYGQPTLQLQSGDWLLLCSDGIWGSVPDERITEVLTNAPDCPAAARVLVELALQAGAPDNASVVVARCVRAPSW